MIELWHEWNSVHSLKVRIVLAEKGLAWTDRRIELLKFEQLSPGYLALRPDGAVPTLVHDGIALFDSSPVCEYLNETFPSPALMPDTPLERAHVRSWLAYHDQAAHPALRDASFPLLFKPRLSAMPRGELEALAARHPFPERRKRFLEGASAAIDWTSLAAAARACERIAARIDAGAREREWLEGGMFTLADVAMAPFADRIENLGMNWLWDRRPAGAAWSRRVLARPGVQASLAPAEFRLPEPRPEIIAELRRRLDAAVDKPEG